MERLSDDLGRAGGRLLAPITGTVSALRRARMFHPDGLTYFAQVEPAAIASDLRAAATRLAGTALVRLSNAWWKGGRQWPDVLGFALRVLDDEHAPAGKSGELATARSGDQDLLFATIRFPWTTPFAPLATNPRSFLWNHYHAVSPFEIEGVGRVKLRLRSPRISPPPGVSRAEHLAKMVAERRACWTLEVRRLSRPAWMRGWEPLATLRLTLAAEIDQEMLRFSPFLTGRGIRPTGFVHHLRLAAYASSQASRPGASGRSAAER
jgi:hypothetical protein